MSFEVAKAQYSRKPTKEVYKPYSGGSFASRAYAIPWGTTTKPTVMPATFSFDRRYRPERQHTSNQITDQPCEVVVCNPSQEREQAVQIVLDPVNSRVMLAEEVCRRRLGLNKHAVFELGPSNARVDAVLDAEEFV